MGLNLWSTTPATNDMVNYFQTGMRPSAVKTAGWDIMADMAQLWNATPAGGGTANAQTLTNPRPFTTLTTGLTVIYNPSAANTGATTFAPDGLTAKNIFYLTKALVGGELQPNVPAILKYDGTQWNLAWSAKGSAADTYTDTGSVNALVIAANVAQAALVDGMRVKVKLANTTTSTTPTLNIGVGGAINITLKNAVAAPAGCMILNQIADFIYEATANAWVLQNPSRVTGSFTITLTGYASGPTGTVNYAIEPSGKLASVWTVASITGTSNATSMTGTGIPSAIVTSTAGRIAIGTVDAGGGFWGGNSAPNATTWTFEKSFGTAAGFTASGTKGLTTFRFTYPLD